MYVTNLFAFRATDPLELKKAENPMGELNDLYLEEYARKSKIVTVGLGNHGSFKDRGKEIINLLSKIKCIYYLQLLKNGSP